MKPTTPNIGTNTTTRHEDLTIDVLREEVAIEKATVNTGRVQIAKTVTTEDVALRLERLEHRVEVERRPVNESYDELPESTLSLADGTIVYRVIREVPVVVTRYEVVEEVHVRPIHIAHDEELTVPARREHVEVRRTPLSPLTTPTT